MMIKGRSAVLLPLFVAACTGFAAACSGGGNPAVFEGGTGGAPNSSATMTGSTGAKDDTSSGTTRQSPTTSTTGTFSIPVDGSGGSGGTGVMPDDVCAAVSMDTEQVEKEITTTIETEVPAPIALYVVLDNSQSMNSGATGDMGEPTKWEDAVAALTEFVNDPASEGVDIGIQYFHPEGAGAMPDECDGVAHATPAVDVGPLPDNATAIVDSLTAAGPQGYTPTQGALLGGASFCVDFQAQNPDYQCVVVMVTDGQPNGCDLSSNCGMGMQDCVDPEAEATLTPIAADALLEGVTTFTVGMAGVSAEGFALLDAIAVAGGSDCTPGAAGDEACDVSQTGSAGLLEALNTIRNTITVTETMTETVTETVALPCEWEVPEPEMDEVLDPDKVNVVLTFDGVPGDPLGRVPSEAECAQVEGGWYYDDPMNPNTIAVCPDTCEIVTSAMNLNVELQLGCETEIAIK